MAATVIDHGYQKQAPMGGMFNPPHPAAIPLRGLPPIIDERARVLILGSFPSEASLAARQYYAHRQNQFWKILGAALDRPLTEMDYAAKQAAVRAAGVAIWDVYATCERAGSLDSAIRNAVPNDFGPLRKSTPRLSRICFNGGTAGRFARILAPLGIETLILPSTSPANARWSFERKLAAWREGLAV
ncbi:MAG: DNA-deoxyinosine glycosylase [Candidatus Nitricoxidivorans perseverans]|uniref:DNA-deoxyinosine glycosylase n=1 Tax=Candidatus Nitricoxidivorans perseverans TaxID=2975601 RepID=A0AA49FLQ1_9PROT|nr:MAG: DNA-deoxyinosine glycosylase [Candidatus Nitricoxidivorans perseverans]